MVRTDSGKENTILDRDQRIPRKNLKRCQRGQIHNVPPEVPPGKKKQENLVFCSLPVHDTRAERRIVINV